MENKIQINNEILLKELNQLIESSKNRLQNVLNTLGWTIKETLKERPCAELKEIDDDSLNRNDPQLPESFGCKNSVVIDEIQLKSILLKPNASIPQKFSDIQLNFTRDQKCKLYDYVIANTEKTSEPELKVSLPSDDSGNAMTFAEIVAKAKKKDKKLQRKYRTSKPTHIEEVRNLVCLQMKALNQYFNPGTDKDRKRDQCRNERRKTRSRSGSRIRVTSRHRNRSRSRDKRGDTSKIRSRSRGDRGNHVSRIGSPSRRDGRLSPKRRRSKDELSTKKPKKKKTRSSKSPKSHKKHKHKHHRKH